jgi:energy-coupling factor transporter ATP-binding protein EcfA2
VTGATERVLARLKKVGFETRIGGATPFGEELPLVTGVAWETRTAQLALVAESEGTVEDVLWRQLLFAGSGIRRHLSSDAPSAFGTPVILAIVDPAGEKQIRKLTEGLAKDYAVFGRVDINLVLEEHLVDVEKLDDALAPLLPRCRLLLGKEISRQEVHRFWAELRDNVEEAAGKLDDSFGASRQAAGRDGADMLIGDSAESKELPSLAPVRELKLSNFRSIKELEVSLSDVNIVHGPNGGGKTSIVEAMELGWAGTSQRRDGAKASEYAKHLPGNGEGEFTIEVDGRFVQKISEREEAELRRCVLTHEAMTNLVSEEPKERFEGLLTVTGLEIPDLDARTKELAKTAKSNADVALQAAGIAPLARTDSPGLKHLQGALRSNFLRDFSALPELGIVEKTLASVSGGRYSPRKRSGEEELGEQLERADTAVAEAAGQHIGDDAVMAALDEAAKSVDALLATHLEAAGAAWRLLEGLKSSRDTSGDAQVRGVLPEDAADGPIRVDLAARWLNHARGLSQAADRFREEAAAISDEEWAERLVDYADAVDRASARAPDAELERLSQPRQRPQARQAAEVVEPKTYEAAGFSDVPPDPEAIPAPLRELAEVLQAHGNGLREIHNQLKEHPARYFGAHREVVMDAICRFELARTMRRGGPILETSERIVSELLDERLAPVVRELVGAIVRFEWYFKPLQMSTGGKQIVFGGLATDRSDLDARLVLNSAEQTVLGVAWFLGLHMLQPKKRRRVLILDDPTSGFDNTNQAGFASTLRAFVRLLEPEQMVITTHDDAVAAVLAEEFAVVDDWPGSVARLRFQRNGDDFSTVAVEEGSDRKRAVESEIGRLGLPEDAPAVG